MPKKKIDDNIVFNAALNEFTERSFDEASLNTIIKNGNISKGSFYYRFENKYSLYLYLLKSCNQKKWEYINSEMDAPKIEENRENIFDLFLYQAEIGMKFAYKYPRYHQLSKMFSKEKGTPLYSRILIDLGNSSDNQLESMIQTAYNRGDINKDLSLEFVTKVISHLFASFDEIFFEKKEFELKEVMDNLRQFVDFMRRGLE